MENQKEEEEEDCVPECELFRLIDCSNPVNSTVRLFGGYACAGEEVLPLDPLSFLTNPTIDPPLPPHEYCSNRTATEEMREQKKIELQKQKKREIDRRYRLNKQKTVTETENKLAMAVFQNGNLKRTVEKLQQKNIQLTNQLKWFELRFETIYAELEKEIKCTRTEKEFTECPMNYPNI